MGHKSGENAFYLLRPSEAGPTSCTRRSRWARASGSPVLLLRTSVWDGGGWVACSCSAGVGFGSSLPCGYCFLTPTPSGAWASRSHRGPLLSSPQVWFQNRRMKDKRQRLAMTWPHPADPAFYTYMMSHAAAAGGLPYPFPSHLPLPYYSPVGLGAASAASAAASPFSGPLRPLDTFRVLSQPYPRPELLCAFRHPPLYPGPAHGLGASAGGPCSCLACHSGPANGLAPRAAAASDFTCASSRSDSFLTFAPSVLSKASSVALDQREEVPLTR